ncbi:MAG: DNA primase [Candidatus Aminicenantes bacterium]|nr:DNA primase [Candidatus Aminicenantes bacterium]
MEITEKIKAAVSIVDLASQYTTLKKRGKKWVGLCPFHSEKDPSFTVDEEKQLFHCFGCGIGGDLFSLVMEKENLTFPEAIKYLAEKYHIPLPENKISYRSSKLEEKIFEINEKALTYFRNNLFKTLEGKKALEYLRTRNFTEETINKLKIGYALNSWDSLFRQFSKTYNVHDLEKAGLIIPGSRAGEYRDRFRGRIIFPILTLTGRVVAFGGRTIFDAQPKYLNSPETQNFTKGEILYGLYFSRDQIKKAEEAILVEGYADFAAVFQAGFQNVVASMGTSLTSHQVNQLRRYAPRLIINYDGDEAGIKAAARAVPICLQNGLQCRVLLLPEGLDPDGFIKKYGAEKYEPLLRKATDGFRFLLWYYSRQVNLRKPEEKSRLARMVVQDLSRLSDPIIRNEYVKQAAEYLRIGEELLYQLMEREQAPSTSSNHEEKELFLPAEKRLLQIIFTQEEILPLLIEELKLEYFEGLPSEPIIRYLHDCFRENRSWPLSGLQEAGEARLVHHLARLLQEYPPSASVGEALDCLNTLRKLSLQKKLKSIQREISLAEKKGDKEKLTSLLYLKHEITKQILAL